MKLKLGNHAHIAPVSFMGLICLVAAGCSYGAEGYTPEHYDLDEQDSSTVDTSGATDDVSSPATQPPSKVGANETRLVSVTTGDEGEPASDATELGDSPADTANAGSDLAPVNPPVQALEPSAPALGKLHDTLVTSGRRVLDTCGNPFVTRGVEQIFGEQLPEGNDWVGLLEDIADSGVNAVRVLAGTNRLQLSDVDALITAAGERGLVVYVTPYGSEAMNWLGGDDVRAMLAKHEKFIIIDAFGEPTFDDRERFLADSKDAIRQVREWGYRVPLTVTANQFGRDLPSVLELGAEIVASDPLANTILGWQAYWSSNGYYQELYGMSYDEAIEAIAGAPFPIQLGLDRVTDSPSTQTADFGALMSGTAAHGIGWLWWDWYNPYGNENNLTVDGSAVNLTPTGQAVIDTHAASVRNTSSFACAR